MGFMISGQHAFEITDRRFSYCAEIDMNKHEQGDNKTSKDMQEIGDVKTA